MMKNPNDNLFESSKMTFGEHLEELRTCLSRALIGLFIGFLVGLAVATPVMRLIERPLKEALERHYIEVGTAALQEAHGKEAAKVAKEFMRQQGLISDIVFIEPEQVARVASRLAQPGNSTATDVDEENENQSLAGLIEERETLAAEMPQFEGMIPARIWRPLRTQVTTLSAQEGFMIWLKAGFVTGLILASPYIFWQIWNFVAAGLYPHEQRYVYIYLPFSIILFVAGVSLAFFFVFEPVLDFLLSFNRAMDIDPDPRISEWMGFVLFLPLGFGVAFQLPLVMLFLNRLTLVSIQTYLEKWRIAILVIFVISMMLTPADPLSMIFMAVPLTFLYFLGIALCRWMPRGRNPFDEAYEPAA